MATAIVNSDTTSEAIPSDRLMIALRLRVRSRSLASSRAHLASFSSWVSTASRSLNRHDQRGQRDDHVDREIPQRFPSAFPQVFSPPFFQTAFDFFHQRYASFRSSCLPSFASAMP